MDNFSFFDLRVYQESKGLVKSVYELMKKFPIEEKFALCDQLRRSVTSIPSNIAEGSGRISPKEKLRFIEIAYGSLMEVLCQLDIAYDLDYITKEEFNKEKDIINIIGKQLSGMRNSFNRQIEKSLTINR